MTGRRSGRSRPRVPEGRRRVVRRVATENPEGPGKARGARKKDSGHPPRGDCSQKDDAPQGRKSPSPGRPHGKTPRRPRSSPRSLAQPPALDPTRSSSRGGRLKRDRLENGEARPGGAVLVAEAEAQVGALESPRAGTRKPAALLGAGPGLAGPTSCANALAARGLDSLPMTSASPAVPRPVPTGTLDDPNPASLPRRRGPRPRPRALWRWTSSDQFQLRLVGKTREFRSASACRALTSALVKRRPRH